MRSPRKRSRRLAFAVFALGGGGASSELACHRIVGIDDVQIADASARDVARPTDGSRGGDADRPDANDRSPVCMLPLVDIDRDCTDSCQCPVDAFCRLLDQGRTSTSCCRLGDLAVGATCDTNCQCVSGFCSLEDNECH